VFGSQANVSLVLLSKHWHLVPIENPGFWRQSSLQRQEIACPARRADLALSHRQASSYMKDRVFWMCCYTEQPNNSSCFYYQKKIIALAFEGFASVS
jgi:hypothetical protein